MAKFSNNAAGARGVNLEDGTTIWLEPGEAQDIKNAAKAQHPDFDLPAAQPAESAESAEPAEDTGKK